MYYWVIWCEKDADPNVWMVTMVCDSFLWGCLRRGAVCKWDTGVTTRIAPVYDCYHGRFLPSATKLRRLCFYTCLSFCPRGGVCLSACWDTTPLGADPPHRHPPGANTPLGADTPWEQTPPEQTPPGADTLPRSRNPPRSRHPPEMATVADGTHPTGMLSCNGLELLFY